MKFYPLFKKRWKIPVWVSVILLCLFFGLTFLVVAVLTREEYSSYYFEQLQTESQIFYFNFFPIVWVIGLLYAMSRRALFSGLCGLSIFSLMAAINLMKTTLREDPFVPQDIRLIKEAFSIADNYIYGGTALIIAAIILLIAILAVIFLLFKPDSVHWGTSIGLGVLIIITALGTVNGLYSDKEIYKSFPYIYGGKATEYGCKGFVYSFIYDITTMNIEKPEENDPSLFNLLEEEGDDPEDYSEVEKPHIIAIMGEAFSLVSNNEAFDFSNSEDPLKNYNRMAADSLLSGTLAVDSYGGGTAYTEFAFLTGVTPATLNTVAPYDYVRQNMDSMARQLAKVGYENFAIHPGFGWFYNRNNVYKYLGFSEYYNRDNSFDPETQLKSGFINEEATMDVIIDRFQNHLDTSDAPLFEFCVTIQNHGPYNEKYAIDDGYNFDSDIKFTAVDKDILINYFYGLRDVDRELGRLVKYLDSVDEPVILVYFGDHMPSLSYPIYDALGMSFDGDIESFLSLYTTPFAIWQNKAARKSSVMAENLAKIELETGSQISSYYLGSTLMQLLGFDGLSPYYTYLNELRTNVPVMTLWEKYRDAEGTAMTKAPEGYEMMVAKLLGWGYYKLFQQVVS